MRMKPHLKISSWLLLYICTLIAIGKHEQEKSDKMLSIYLYISLLECLFATSKDD